MRLIRQRSARLQRSDHVLKGVSSRLDQALIGVKEMIMGDTPILF